MEKVSKETAQEIIENTRQLKATFKRLRELIPNDLPDYTEPDYTSWFEDPAQADELKTLCTQVEEQLNTP